MFALNKKLHNSYTLITASPQSHRIWTENIAESINWAMVKPQKKTRQFRNGTGSHGAGQKETRTTAPKLTFAKTVKIVHFDPESSTSTRFPEVAVPADGTRRSRRIRFIWRFFLCGSSRCSTDHAKSNLEAYEDKRQTISKTKK